MSNSDLKKTGTIAFTPGVDFSLDEIEKWRAQIHAWISQTQVNEPNPKAKADRVLESALKGVKLNGEAWANIESFNIVSRIKQLCGFNIETGKGRYRKPYSLRGAAHPQNRKARAARKVVDEVLYDANEAELMDKREEKKELLFQEFPWLDTPIYEVQVNALCEALVQLESTSEAFMTAKGKTLASIIELREGLNKQIDSFQKQLRIHPSQLKDRGDDIERGDVGTLINKWEEYGEIGLLFEQVDAIQELIQTIRQVEQVRLDGSPQLADWLLWHKTGTKPIRFICEHGTEYLLYDGFTEAELYEAAEQAYRVFGYGLRKIDEERAFPEEA